MIGIVGAVCAKSNFEHCQITVYFIVYFIHTHLCMQARNHQHVMYLQKSDWKLFLYVLLFNSCILTLL